MFFIFLFHVHWVNINPFFKGHIDDIDVGRFLSDVEHDNILQGLWLESDREIELLKSFHVGLSSKIAQELYALRLK